MRPMALIIAVIIWVLVAAACQPTALPPIPQTTAESAASAPPQRIGIIFEGGDVEGNPLYRLALEGIDNAAAVFPVEVTPLEILNQADVVTEIEGVIGEGYDLLIDLGTEPLHQALASTARSNPDQLFVSVEHPADEPNVLNIQFDMAQPSFLAGYLAAGVSATGVVCTYGNPDVEHAIDYVEGFANGVRYYNIQHDAAVALLGWDHDTQVGAIGDSLQSSRSARQIVTDYFAVSCDVLFTVSHTINLWLASMAQDHELAVIGTDVDWFVIAPEWGGIWLTSVQKNLDQALFDTIAALTADELIMGEHYTGTLANGGVGLAPFHFWGDKIPDDLKVELEEINQALVVGKLEP